MGFPEGASTITLTGLFPVPVGGTARTGRLVLSPSAVLVDRTQHAIYSGGGAIDLEADGTFSVQLLCDDDPDVLPEGWRWQVDEQPAGGVRRTYWIELPSTLGPTISLDQVAEISAPGPGSQTPPAGGPPTGPAGGALTGTYPSPSLAPATIASFDPAGAASAAQAAAATDATTKASAAQSAAAADATAKVAAHTAAADPHGDRAWADSKFALATDVEAIEQGTAVLAGGHFTAPVDITSSGLSLIRFLGRRATTGAPTTGAWTAGDVVQDSAGAWWLCTTTGTPGTWTGTLSTNGGTATGPLNVDRFAAPAGYPIGQAGSVASLNILSSYAGGDDDGTGTDTTGRINLYSYQRANVGSFGETIRQFAMRSDAKSMEAFYIPVDASKKGGYDPATRDPKTSGVSFKPVVWAGSHYEANDHGSIHGHWELEIADLNGALQGRLEIPFIDQPTDGSKPLDQATIGVAYTNIRTNLADLSVRAQNMTAGPYTGQNTAFRVGGNNTVNKDILLSISSDMGTTGRRWGLRANNTTESGSNAGTDFQIRRYADDGTFLDAPVHIERSTGRVGMGGVTAPTAGLHLQRATGQLVYLDAQATTQSAILVTGVDATVKALQGQVTGDTQKRYQVLVDGTQSYGPGGTTAPDLTVGRGGAGILAIGGTANATVAATTTTAYAALVTGDPFDRYRTYGDGKQEWGPGNAARDTNQYRSNPGVLKTDGALQATTSLRLNTTSLGGGVGVLALANATTAPASNPTAGVVMYVSGGRLKIRQPDGTDQFVALTAT